jgi:small subunit ribosomal protein S13
MARIVGVDIPDNKRCEIALTHIYGIGRSMAKTILLKNNIENKYIKDLSEKELQDIRDFIANNLTVEGDLRNKVKMNIKLLTDIRCYRGIRHLKGLPVRGQSTKNNCRTRKGKRKTVANKKKVTK